MIKKIINPFFGSLLKNDLDILNKQDVLNRAVEIIHSDGAIFPPCQSELYQQILCVSYVAHLWSHAYLSIPSELSPLNYRYMKENNITTFKWFQSDQVPSTISSITILDENPTIEQLDDDDAEEFEEERPREL